MTDAPLAQLSGLVHGMPSEVYHGHEIANHFVSRSGLLEIAKAPAIFYGRHRDPKRPPQPEPTEAMVLGTMTHCAVLEPDAFVDRYAVAPKCDRRTKEGKAIWAAFLETLKPGMEAADPEMVQKSLAMAMAVRENPAVSGLLDEGDAEVSAFVQQEKWSGVAVRVRPDFVSPAGGNKVILTDLKTTIDASPKGFGRTVANMAYDVQAALYSDIFEQASGKRVVAFVFVAVEKAWPFACVPYVLKPDAIDRGRRKYRRLLETYAECMRTQTWPGYTSGREIEILELPAWAEVE